MVNLQNVSYLVLAASIIFTIVLWYGFLDSESHLQYNNFEANIETMTKSTSERLTHYEQMLIGAKGLFAASDKVSMEEWKTYIQVQNIDKRFQGIQGVGYIQHITNDEREDLISELKNYGMADFTVHPEGIRDEYYPIIFLEPLDVRNKRAIGYDVFFQETRHEAVEILKETGQTTITGKIILVQEIDDDIQNGFLMFTPVYSNNPLTPHDLQGMTYSVFRMNDFVLGILDIESFQYTNMKIYDNIISEESLFFDSSNISPYEINAIDFSKTINISVNNRDWIFVYEGIQPPYLGLEQIALFLIPIIGLSMSLLLFFIFRLFVSYTINQGQMSRLKEIEKEKHEFLSMITHELKTPLTPILGWAEALSTPKIMGELTKKQLKAINAISSSARSLERLIGDMLDVQKLTLEKMMINNNSFDVKEMLGAICENNKPEFKSKNVKLLNNCKNRIIIKSDIQRVEQIFNNLIQNAFDFIPKDTGVVELNAEKERTSIKFSVKDNGLGISEKNKENLFKKFYQVDTSVTRKHGGTGLGLAICKGVIEKMGGKIWCESKLGEGTIFYFNLPIDIENN